MELKNAYDKIDNFCCSNHNSLQGNTVIYLNGREEKINMFADYQETKDDDFCKDANEMVEALETIKKALEEREAINNAEPSKALKELNIIRHLEIGFDKNGKPITLNDTNGLSIIKNVLLKVQEQELHNGGRLPNKEILYLKQSIEQGNDKPIFYVSRTYGNKYIVPQKHFDNLTNENVELKSKAQKEHKALEIIKEKKVDMWHLTDLLEQTYDMYLAFCKSEKYEEDYILTEEEFNLLKEVLE